MLSLAMWAKVNSLTKRVKGLPCLLGSSAIVLQSRCKAPKACIQRSSTEPGLWDLWNTFSPKTQKQKMLMCSNEPFLICTGGGYITVLQQCLVSKVGKKRKSLKERIFSQVCSFDVQKYIYFQQFQNHCLFFTVEIFKWNNKTKNSICIYTVYI